MKAIWFLAIIVIAVLGAWLAFSVSDFTTINNTVLAILLVALGLISAAPDVYYLRHGSEKVVSPISVVGFSFLVYGFIGTLPVMWDPGALLVGERGLRFLPFATFLFILGFLSFCLGYFSLANVAPQPRGIFQWKKDRLWLGVFVLAGAAWGVRYYTTSKGITIPRYVSEGDFGLPAIFLISNPYVLSLMFRANVLSWAAFSICLIAYFRVFADRPVHQRRRWLFVGLFLIIMEGLYIVGITLSKALLFGVALTIFCVMSLVHKPPIKQALLFMIFFVLLVLPLVNNAKRIGDTYRLSQMSFDFGQISFLLTQIFPQAAVETLVIDYEISPDRYLGHSTRLSGVDYVTFLAEAQEIQGIPPMGPWPVIENLLGLVPRVLWPGKPLTVVSTDGIKAYYGYLAFDLMDMDMVVSPLAEFYAFFGIWGVMLGMFTIGVLMRILYRGLIERFQARWNTGLVLYSVLAYDLLYIERGIAGTLALSRDLFLLWVFLSVVLEGRIPMMGWLSKSSSRVERSWRKVLPRPYES